MTAWSCPSRSPASGRCAASGSAGSASAVAEGELEIGYDAGDRVVRVEYHWVRLFSRANPQVPDVYTAELWVRQRGGDWLYLVHNRYLLVASESGLLALAAFLWFLYAVVRCGLGCVRSGDDLLAPLASGLVAGVVGTLVTMSAEPFAGRAQVQGLWLVSALLVAMAALIAAPREASVRS